jgi:hypothetical protein
VSELLTKSVAQQQQEQKMETRTVVERIAGFIIVATSLEAFPATARPSQMAP